MKKAFGLAIVAALALMVSASAAQALTLKVNGAADAEEAVTGSVNAGFLLVEDLGLKITCTGGTASATLKSSGGTVTGEGSAKFTGCDVVGAATTCSVNSPGQPDGTITAKGSGTVTMEGAKTYADLSSGNFSEIEIQGICAAAETEETVSGSATLTLLNPEEELVTHNIQVDDKALAFGTDKALLHSTAGPGNPIGGSATTVSEKKWSITLP